MTVEKSVKNMEVTRDMPLRAHFAIGSIPMQPATLLALELALVSAWSPSLLRAAPRAAVCTRAAVRLVEDAQTQDQSPSVAAVVDSEPTDAEGIVQPTNASAAPMPAWLKLNKKLAKGKQNDDVLSLVEANVDTLNGQNVATALHRLAIINKRKRAGRDALMRDRRYALVIDALVAQSTEFNARAVSDVLWSFATLRDWPPTVLMPVLTSIAAQLQAKTFEGRHLCTVVWGLGALVDRGLFTQRPTRLLEMIEAQAVDQLGGMNDQNIANLLWGFAKLGYKPQALLPQVSAALLAPGMVDQAKHVEVTDLAFALAKLGGPGDFGELMGALALRATPETLLKDFSSRQLVKLLEAYASLEATSTLPDGLLEVWVDTVRAQHVQTSVMARDARTLEAALEALGMDSSWVMRTEMLSTWSELSGSTGEVTTRRSYTDEELRAVFDSIDTDKSGDIDLDELRQAVEKVSANADDESLRKMLEFGDSDGDAVVSFEEFKEIINKGAAGQRVGLV